jgi:ApbE superfamily uncharacterized protein (UPF0280 family)
MLLGKGDRLHLNHGPIDLIIGADGPAQGARSRAFEAAAARFETILEGLVVDLDQHRRRLLCDTPLPTDPVAQRMYTAALPFCTQTFLTPMIAVAGSVADEVLAAMRDSVSLTRAYVNNGGDIAVHLAQGASFSIAMAQDDGRDLGRVRFSGEDGIGGIATSGARGRSHSLGIADSVTVLAQTAAQTDVAATLIANAVDLPDHTEVLREPACALQPDSDLGDRMVVTHVPRLGRPEREEALLAGAVLAQRFLDAGHVKGAALFLQGDAKMLGHCAARPNAKTELEYA